LNKRQSKNKLNRNDRKWHHKRCWGKMSFWRLPFSMEQQLSISFWAEY